MFLLNIPRFKKLTFLLAIITIMAMQGCATTVKLTNENRQSVQTLHINQDITDNTKELYIETTAKQMGAAFGLLGAALTANAGKSDAEKISKMLKDNNIDIKDILISEFNKQFSDAKIFPKVSNQIGDATLNITLHNYGLIATRSIVPNDEMKPFVSFFAEIKKQDGTVIWTSYGRTNEFTPDTPATSIEELLASPSKLRESYQAAATTLVRSVLANMEG